MIEPTNNVNLATDPSLANGAAGGAAGPASSNDTIDQQQFLMLFISQLQNQDPLNPLDVNGMTDQLAQFSSLEQLFGINSKLEDLTSALDAGHNLDPLMFLDTEVSAPGSTLEVTDGKATPVVLDVAGDAASVVVSILGPGGTPVREVDLGSHAPGDIEFIFDGKDSRGGAVLDGNYTLSVAATDHNGDPIETETFIRGKVTGVDLTTGVPTLLLGTRAVSVTDVRDIRTQSEARDSE
jgi:flagellar basal-body rod modification protein FlgD